MKKQCSFKVLSLALSLCLLISSLFTGMVISADDNTGSVDVWDGTSIAADYTGSGTKADPYLIQSAADLAFIAGKSGGTYHTDKYFLLTTDIDLNNKSLLGNNLNFNYFGGILDGNGHEIKGIKMNQTALANVGFIREFKGTIKNLTLTGSVTGSSASDKGNVGGFVAKAVGACTISNCVNNLNVTGGICVGGFIGNAYPGKATVNIFSCVNNGTITSKASGTCSTAGFVGYVGKDATINFTYCQNNGTVSTAGTDVGGFVGGNNIATANFDHCINAGDITASHAAGGFVGWSHGAGALSFKNVINYGMIHSVRQSGSPWIDGILGVHSRDNTGYNNSTITKEKVYAISGCLDFGVVADNQANLTTHVGTLKPLSDFTADTINSLLGFYYVIDENGKPALRQYSSGKGTQHDPYVIKTKEELIMLSQVVITNQWTDYENGLFVLGNDIDLENDTRFGGIGNGYKSFKADFDGKGYTVSNINVQSAHMGGIGFFGVIGGTNARKISNLHVTGTVKSTDTTLKDSIVGGLVGKNTVNLSITNCSFDGNVSSKQYASVTLDSNTAATGLVSEAAAALSIEHCYVGGKIEGRGNSASFVGTLRGEYTVYIANSYSTATVTGMPPSINVNPYAGGLVGRVAGKGTVNIVNCFFAGTAPAAQKEGTYAGYCGPIVSYKGNGTVTCNNVYYIGDSAAEIDAQEFGTFKSAAEFKDGTVLSFLNANGVVFAQGENHPVFMTKSYNTADLTADGIVDTADAILVLRHIEDVETLSDDALIFADINEDGNITEADYFTVKYFALVGIVVDEPAAASWSDLG